MVSYTNETKIKDIPDPSLELEVKELLKGAILDFGSDMKKETFDHTVKRICYILKLKYKMLMLGEVKYVFETMVEFAKGKLNVAVIMQLFWKYYDEKIERQRREIEEREIANQSNYVNCANTPLGSAIIYRMEHKDCELSLKHIAEKIKTGELQVAFKPDRKVKHIWNLE